VRDTCGHSMQQGEAGSLH